MFTRIQNWNYEYREQSDADNGLKQQQKCHEYRQTSKFKGLFMFDRRRYYTLT